jgi:hypothetical protein
MAQAGGGAERRRRPRIPVHGEVMGRIHTVASAPFVDLSETGALLEVACALRPGSFYTLRFTLPPPDGRELALKARVVRSFVQGFQAGAQGDNVIVYRTAVEFIDTPADERAALQRHLSSGGPHPGPGGMDGFDEDFGDEPGRI